jgi:putative transposase
VAALIAARRADGIPVAVACRALGVSRAWFCKHKDGRLPPREQRRERLKAEVARLFAAHEGKYGSPRITADLREAGWRVSANTVAALMAGQHLAARRKNRRKSTTRPGKGRWRAPDLVKRDFPAAQINTKWYGDGTEIPTGEGKLYLASVLDMASRRILGFALGEHHDAQLAYGALAMAVTVRGGQVPGVVFHTGQGSEYTAGMIRSACTRLGIRQSMGRPGSALDNAVIESWHSTLEFELRALEHFAAKAAARARIPAWIDDYNYRRRHSALAMMSPVDYEKPCRPGRRPEMNPASSPPSISRRPAASRSFLLGPHGPAGPPPGHRLHSGGYMAPTKKRDPNKINPTDVSTLSGEPRLLADVEGHRGRRALLYFGAVRQGVRQWLPWQSGGTCN